MSMWERSRELYERAVRVIPGGVNSPVRSFRSVGGAPVFIDHGSGSRVWDVDGNSYIDYVMSYGPLLFGHAPALVVEAIRRTMEQGTSFGAATEREVVFAELLCSMVPSLQKVRLVNSGTEAVMSAVRVARAWSGKPVVLKFAGCYHGHSDGFLSNAGSGLATYDLPDSAGVPPSLTREMMTLPYNDTDAFVEAFNSRASEIGCVIVEPVAANMGVIPPKEGFLSALRELTQRHRAALIFDEVITGFRVARGGAQELFGVVPDISTLGKIVGGGLPLAAYGGKHEIMDMVAPTGPVYQAGTLSGNPLAVAAGLEVLHAINRNPALYNVIDEKAAKLAERLSAAASAAGYPHRMNRVGSIMTLFFTDHDVVDYETAKTSDTALFARFFREMLKHGVSLAPSQFEAAFVSTAHSDADIEMTIDAARGAFSALGAEASSG
jgi:glutamate-1-semialdehyde 2,1-aminomutase